MLEDLIEVLLPQPHDFLKVIEVLSRIGISSRKEKTLHQSCHILHKKGQYYIVHFKQLFQLDGKETNFSEDDQARTNTIANLLAEWGLVTLVDKEKSATPVVPVSQIKIVSFKEKPEWQFITKYTIGKRR